MLEYGFIFLASLIFKNTYVSHGYHKHSIKFIYKDLQLESHYIYMKSSSSRVRSLFQLLVEYQLIIKIKEIAVPTHSS